MTESGSDGDRADGVDDGSGALYAAPATAEAGEPLAPGAAPAGPDDRVAGSLAVDLSSGLAAPTVAALSAVLATSLASPPAADASAGCDGPVQGAGRSGSSSPANVLSLSSEGSGSEPGQPFYSDADSDETAWWEGMDSDLSSQGDPEADADAWVLLD